MNWQQLTFPRIYAPARDYTLPEPLYIEHWIVAQGTVINLQQTENFGWVRLPKGAMDERGFEIPKRLFKI